MKHVCGGGYFVIGNKILTFTMSDTEGERPQEVLESPREPDEDEAVGTASSNVSGNISVKREGTKEESSEALAPKRPRRRLEFR